MGGYSMAYSIATKWFLYFCSFLLEKAFHQLFLVPSPPSTIVREDSGEGSRFSDSKTVLYKFQLSDVEESFHVINEEYQVITSDHKTRDDLLHVLFTRRNTEREANRFLAELGENEVLQELTEKYALHHHSMMNCCRPRVTPAWHTRDACVTHARRLCGTRVMPAWHTRNACVVSLKITAVDKLESIVLLDSFTPTEWHKF